MDDFRALLTELNVPSNATWEGLQKLIQHDQRYAGFTCTDDQKQTFEEYKTWLARKQELETAYSPSRWSHRMGPDAVIDDHIKTLTDGSNIAMATIDCELGISYGLTEAEKFDVYGAKTLPGDAPIFVYIHGGYWQLLGLYMAYPVLSVEEDFRLNRTVEPPFNRKRELSSFMVPSLAKAGAVVVVIGYELAPKANMDEIVQQVKRGISFVLTMGMRRGSSGVYLCGSSAGAHLCAMMLAQDWMSACMVSHSFIRGAVLVSGLYDLRPLVNTYVNDPIKMTEEDALRNSPVHWLDKIAELSQNRKIMTVFAEHDPPEFQRQSTEWNSALLERGIKSSMMVVMDTDHFNVIENLKQEDYVLTKEVLRLMCLNIETLVDKMGATGIS